MSGLCKFGQHASASLFFSLFEKKWKSRLELSWNGWISKFHFLNSGSRLTPSTERKKDDSALHNFSPRFASKMRVFKLKVNRETFCQSRSNLWKEIVNWRKPRISWRLNKCSGDLSRTWNFLRFFPEPKLRPPFLQWFSGFCACCLDTCSKYIPLEGKCKPCSYCVWAGDLGIFCVLRK